MSSSFGVRLRSHRESQHISLATVATQTKIKQSLLEALERDDVSHWPTGLFGRSYIRAYAQAVGLDPVATVREFLESYPGTIESEPVSLDDARGLIDERSNRRPPPRIKFLIESAIDAIHTRRAELGRRRPSRVDRPPALAPVVAPVESVATTRVASEPVPSAVEPTAALDFPYIAHLCTRLACAQEAHEVGAALEDAASLLDAVGVILWAPDALGVALLPVFAYGYADEVIAQMPRISLDANNATTEAFKTQATCIVNGGGRGTGAIVAPLLTPSGCAGVLALELRDGAEQREDVRAAVAILAAQVSTLMGFSVLAQTRSA
jgi:hypothetical protein